MSGASTGDTTEEEEDCFHDSLDRTLSSSNSSTSASEDDESLFSSPPHPYNYHHHHNNGALTRPNTTTKLSPRFPLSVRNYEAWVSDAAFSSSSLQQRRDRLLRALGLSSDPTLSRRKSSFTDSNGFAFSRSVASDRIFAADTSASGIHADSPVIRCKSEGDFRPSRWSASAQHDHLSNLPSSVSTSTTTTTILSIDSASINTVNSNVVGFMNNDGLVQDLGGGVGDLASAGSSGPLAASSEPSSGNDYQANGEIPGDFAQLVTSHALKGGDGCNGEDVKSNGTEESSSQMCTIKNLDTGKEFVVNEVKEDGTWKKLREVGTGRQLTMEEFEMCVGHSPIVQELMRRQNVEDQAKDNSDANADGNAENVTKPKKRVSWLRSIKSVASSVTGHKEKRSSDERDTSSEKGGRRSSSATDDSQDVSFHGPERARVRQYGKSVKELTGLYKSQEIHAHNGSIWAIKFSLDGRYLASAGEDCVIHVWQVVQSERKGELLIDRRDDLDLSLLLLANGSPEPSSLSPGLESPLDLKRRGRTSVSRKSMSLDHILVPDTVFGLSEKPVCSFQGHLDDVLDLSWSKSQLLLSSSMDKTVRLWDLTSKSCLKTFSHSDYVTCIQFNPVDDRYFISGSLDAKVRIWSILDRQVVDWNDLHEMVTAACYTSDGQGALVGSYKGGCRLYNTSENKLQQKSQINLQNKKKKAHLKKITGFQFAPGSSSEVLVTSADSRVRVVDGDVLIHKFKGFRNTNSQISASITANGKYVVCASEDSHVYVWKHEGGPRPGRSKGVTVTRSYEQFHSQDVTVAIPWPGCNDAWGESDPCSRDEPNGTFQNHPDEGPTVNRHPPTPVEDLGGAGGQSPFRGTISRATNSYFVDRMATWPEEKLPRAAKNSPRYILEQSNGPVQCKSAWGMVIVTAGLRGEIQVYQNFGLPLRT